MFLPATSVVGAHMPKYFTPFAKGVVNLYEEKMNSRVAIWPSVKHALTESSPGFGSTLFGQRLAAQGWRFGLPWRTLKIARQAA
jgi:hypothetical protein